MVLTISLTYDSSRVNCVWNQKIVRIMGFYLEVPSVRFALVWNEQNGGDDALVASIHEVNMIECRRVILKNDAEPLGRNNEIYTNAKMTNSAASSPTSGSVIDEKAYNYHGQCY